MIICPDQENDATNMIFSKTTTCDYENLCSLDILDIEENHNKRDNVGYDEFLKKMAGIQRGGVKLI